LTADGSAKRSIQERWSDWSTFIVAHTSTSCRTPPRPSDRMTGIGSGDAVLPLSVTHDQSANVTGTPPSGKARPRLPRAPEPVPEVPLVAPLAVVGPPPAGFGWGGFAGWAQGTRGSLDITLVRSA
jgi:hypothetical protein